MSNSFNSSMQPVLLLRSLLALNNSAVSIMLGEKHFGVHLRHTHTIFTQPRIYRPSQISEIRYSPVYGTRSQVVTVSRLTRLLSELPKSPNIQAYVLQKPHIMCPSKTSTLTWVIVTSKWSTKNQFDHQLHEVNFFFFFFSSFFFFWGGYIFMKPNRPV